MKKIYTLLILSKWLINNIFNIFFLPIAFRLYIPFLKNFVVFLNPHFNYLYISSMYLLSNWHVDICACQKITHFSFSLNLPHPINKRAIICFTGVDELCVNVSCFMINACLILTPRSQCVFPRASLSTTRLTLLPV